MPETMQFCRSRSAGRRCTRELDHRGLHRHRTIMWSDAGSDPARCPGSGSAATPAAVLPSGFPHGRALCEVCLNFVGLASATLVEHDTSAPSDPEAAAWFNAFGW